MKTLLTTFGSMLAAVAFGQITITSSDFPSAGDNSFVSQAMDLTIDFGTTGPNTTWDFSGLTPNGQVYKEYIPMSQASGLAILTFGSFAPANYQASYFTEATTLPIDQITNFLPIPLENIYQFHKKMNDSITAIGYAMEVSGQAIPAKSDTIETRYKFPLNYQDEYVSRGYTDLDLNPIYDAAWIQHSTRSSYVDGWGQITTPYGTFDAIRVQHYITENDSINFQGNWFAIPVPDSYEYEWLATGEYEPILRIRTTDVGGNEVVTGVEYKDYFQPALASQELAASEARVFPNPAMEEVNLHFSRQPEKVVIVAANGSIYQTLEQPQLQNTISLSAAESGQYLIIASFLNGDRTVSHFVKP